MRKTPYTNKELFDAVNEFLKEKSLLPDILDYGLSSHTKEAVDSYAFSPAFKLDYGDSEGIYLDVAIVGSFNNTQKTISLGTYKTLSDGDDAMHTMAALEADFLIALHKLVNENLQDFTWSGYDLIPLDENGNRKANSCGYEIQNPEKIMDYVNRMLSGGCYAVRVIDNATKKATDYENEQEN